MKERANVWESVNTRAKGGYLLRDVCRCVDLMVANALPLPPPRALLYSISCSEFALHVKALKRPCQSYMTSTENGHR